MSTGCPHRPWMEAAVASDRVEVVASATGLSDVVARVLVARGLTDAESVSRFLEPSLVRDWHDPSLIPGMDDAATVVADAVTRGRRIVVFGDFDLDGISAAAVATLGLRALGTTVEAIVPHRFNEGYGLSAAAVQRALELQPDLLITVDCGISGAEQVARLVDAGVDVVVTDHHEPGAAVPQGVPVANPKLDPECISRDLAGAGVALKLVHAVGRLLGQPDAWVQLADVAMLGTVADIVTLMDENRALVAQGVALARNDARAPIRALCDVAGVAPSSFASDTVSFALAPRLNAAGRMADPAVALELLLTVDPERARVLAGVLDEHNRTRQAVEAELAQAAMAQAQERFRGQRALVLAGEGWHEGVKGIVASRVAQAFGVPALLFSVEDGVAKGSGRSIGSVDLFCALTQCESVLDRFGGHEAAVGLALESARLPEFEALLLEHLDTLPAEQFVTGQRVDSPLALDEVSVELGAELSLLEPFGHGNPRPVFGTRGAFMHARERVGKTGTHLRFTAYDGVASVPAIAFRCPEITQLEAHDAAVDLAYEISVDEWRGRRRVQLIVRDIAVVSDEERGAAAALVEDLFARADEIVAREEYAGITDAPSFHTKLAGVTFDGRQEAVMRLEAGAPLRLVRQPDNAYDPNACAVFDAHGVQIGFLNRRLAAALSPAMDAGVEYDGTVADVTGGADGQSLGVNIVVSRRDLVVGEAEPESTVATRDEFRALPAAQLKSALVQAFIGDRELHDAQAQALELLAARRNALVVMATGRGKSLIFHLHAAQMALSANQASVFVFPLRALVADQAFHLGRAFSSVGLNVRTVTGESSPGERDEAFSQVGAGDVDVVLTTPEFLHFHSHRFAETGRFGFVVVDEAHHVGLSRAGHRPSYQRLGEAIASMGSPTVLAVTATASTDVAHKIRSTLGIDQYVLDPTVRDNLAVVDGRGCDDRDARIAALAARGGKMVIYVNSRDATVRLARMLRKRVPQIGWKVAFYNGGMSRTVRTAVETAFRGDDLQVVVATSAFGEGVNIPDIRNVVLYHLPFNEVEFNQMAGRAGRDGDAASIHLLFGEKDARINRTILSSAAPSRDDLATIYRVLKGLHADNGAEFEVTNAQIAERCTAIVGARCSIEERGVSTALGIFRELGLVVSEGHGPHRRLSLVAQPPRTDLETSVRYSEGLEEIAEFADFSTWVLNATPDALLERFNRPILPTE